MTMAAGMYGLTLEKFLNVTSLPASGLESEVAIFDLLVTDTHTPAFDTHNFRDDVNNEVGTSGTYTNGTGGAVVTTELTPASPAATQLKWDADDISYTGTTITARGTIEYFDRGGAASADELITAHVFTGDVSTAGGTFTVQWHSTNGLMFIDYA